MLYPDMYRTTDLWINQQSQYFAFQVLLPVGHRLRQDPHPDHRVGVGAPADHVVLILLRPPHTRLRLPGRTLVLHQGKEGRKSGNPD